MSVIEGTSGNDPLNGGSGADSIVGYAGSDTIYGNAGDDTIAAYYPPSDTVPPGAAGSDTIYGGAGNDQIYGSPDNTEMYGEGGNDIISGSDGIDIIIGGSGADTLAGGASSDIFLGGSAADMAGDVITDYIASNQTSQAAEVDVIGIIGNFSYQDFSLAYTTVSFNGETRDATEVTISGTHTFTMLGSYTLDSAVFDSGEGATILDFRLFATTLEPIPGTSGADTLYADDGITSSGYEFFGYGGDDFIYGGRLDDRAYGGAGADTMYGNEGGDTLYGEGGDDVIYGGDGLNIIEGGAGNDTLYGGNNQDFLKVSFALTGSEMNLIDYFGPIDLGVDGTDWIYGFESYMGVNNEIIIFADAESSDGQGFDGNDTLYGGAGNDTWIGNGGNDVIYGGADNDSIQGNAGNDILFGDAGADTLLGNEGNDTIEGLGAGTDYIDGGTGWDLLKKNN